MANKHPKKEQIVNIDAPDAENELAAVEYIEDMYKFFKLVEVYYYFLCISYSISLFFIAGFL